MSSEILVSIWSGFPLCCHQFTDQYMRLVWTLTKPPGQLIPSQPLVNLFFLRKVQPCLQNPIIAGEVVLLTDDPRWRNFHQICPLGRSGLVVAMSVNEYIYLSPSYVIYFEASHWPSDHMISLRPLISQPFFPTVLPP